MPPIASARLLEQCVHAAAAAKIVFAMEARSAAATLDQMDPQKCANLLEEMDLASGHPQQCVSNMDPPKQKIDLQQRGPRPFGALL